MVKAVAEFLPRASCLHVDDNGRKETVEVMEALLGGRGYQRVRRVVGDLAFKRGRFSRESGYRDEDEGGFGSWDA